MGRLRVLTAAVIDESPVETMKRGRDDEDTDL
jgi:hypothetical protein